ncbi:MAG: hypothetical protein ACW9W3_05450, partial [Candidatus Nitrosopumilus sp. bin_68KS]
MILVLSTLSSGTDYVFAQSAPENFKSAPENFKSAPENFSIYLNEKIGFTEIKKKFDESKSFSVSLHEKISASSMEVKDQIILVKHESDRKIMMERIFDRQSKFQIDKSKLSQIVFPSTLDYDDQNLIGDQILYAHNDLSFDKLYVELNNLIPNIFESEKIFPNFINSNYDTLIQNNIKLVNDQVFDPNNPILLILLIPFAGFVLIRYDNEQIKFYQIKQFFTLTFVVILVASAVITPMSISSSYWGYAYGEIDNSTEIIPQLQDPEIIYQDNVTNISQSNDDLFELDFSTYVSTETQLTQSNNQMSISDILSVTLSQFIDNTTPDSTDLLSADSNISISDILSVTLSQFIDNTTPDSTDLLSADSNISISDILSVTLSQ